MACRLHPRDTETTMYQKSTTHQLRVGNTDHWTGRQVSARPWYSEDLTLRTSQGQANLGMGASRACQFWDPGLQAPSVCPQAVKSKKHIPIQVILAAGGSLTVSVDSASTSQEVCQHIAQKQGLKDQLGFSLQVAVYNKVSTGGLSLHPTFHIHQSQRTLKLKSVPH